MTSIIASVIDQLNSPAERREIERIAGIIAANPHRHQVWIDDKGFVTTDRKRGAVPVGTYNRHATIATIVDDYREAVKDLRARRAA